MPTGIARGAAVVASLTILSRVLGLVRTLVFSQTVGASCVGSWAITIGADVVLVQLAPARLVPAMLALGTTIGQTVAAIPLVSITRRIRGKAAVRGTRRATLTGLAACAAGVVVGVAISLAIPLHHKLAAAALAVPAAACATLAFGVVAYYLDDGDLTTVLAWVRRVARARS